MQFYTRTYRQYAHRKGRQAGHICYTQTCDGSFYERIKASMQQNTTIPEIDKKRQYTDIPSPLAMTPEEFRASSIQTAELAAAYYAERSSKPVYTAPSRETLEHLRSSPLPEHGMPARTILNYFAQEIMPYDMGNHQPTFSPWVNPAAAPISMFLDHLASVMNPTAAKGLHAATEIEKLVIRWLEELIGFPTVGSGGIFVNGGSLANFHGLAADRYRDRTEIGRAGQAVEQGEAVEQNGRGHRPQQHILDRRLC